MEGLIIQFRQGRKTQKARHFLIEVDGSNSREKATEFVGKTAVWTSSGKNATKINGKIAAAHGNKGVLRAIFEKGLPGQAIGTPVEIEGFASDKNKKINKTDANSEQN